MNSNNPFPLRSIKAVSRREFIATGSTLLLASHLSAAGQTPGQTPPTTAAKLAIDGGEKAVSAAAPKAVRFGAAERKQLDDLLGQDSLFYWRGPQTALFIERFKQHCPAKHVMTCGSGTASLHIAVAAAGIGPGDEVITTPITDIGTVIGVLFQQGVPVFADLDPNDYNLDPADVERKITPRTRAIIAVHLAGNPAKLNELRALADRHKLVLIEDAAQAWGARYRGKPVGTIGHFACFSLQDSKQVTCGDGGVVGSTDDGFGPQLQKFGDKGFDRSNPSKGFTDLAANYRMSEPQAAVAAAQMERVEQIAATRSGLGRLLNDEIAGLPGIAPHKIHPEDRCTHYFYMLRMDPKAFRCDRAKFVAALRAEGVPASAGYIPVTLYRMPVFQNHNFFAGRWPVKELGLTKMDYREVNCPEAEAILETCIRVSINEAMTQDYMRQVAEGVRKVAKHYAA